jgi:signal transduction histidine kinase
MIRQQELTEKTQEADRAKSEFLTNMSHEIRARTRGRR